MSKNNIVISRTIEEYLDLPYTIEVQKDDSDGEIAYAARVVELPGCITQGDTFEELEVMMQDAMRAWIESALEDGVPVPEPRKAEEYSGKFVVRVPRSLHRQLATVAERDGVSLNTYVNTTLAQAVGIAQAR